MGSRGRAWVLAVGAMGALAALVLGWPLPGAWFAPSEHRRVLDRDGGVLAEQARHSEGRVMWVALDEVSPVLVAALLSAEDDRFHAHVGVDLWSVARAARANLRAGRVVEGGSTLTQQTARLVAGRGAGWSGKLVEAWRAIRIDLRLSKHEILELYLNRAYFGHGATGVAAAASRYFDETPAGLSISEAATLVALLPQPSERDPWRHPEVALAGRDRVLHRMVVTGRLEADEAARAVSEPLELRRDAPRGLAPHLAAHLLEDRSAAVIEATLDPALQRDVESEVAAQLDALRGKAVDHAAVVVLEVATGNVLAWVGSGDWRAPDGQVDAVRAVRSAGSTLKPFLYGVAFEGPLRDGEVLPDTARIFATTHGTWSPENYAQRFHGPVRSREALASSYNLPAVVLAERVGVSALLARLRHAGFEHLERRSAEYGLGLPIGHGEVTLLELTAAFAGLARGGVRVHPRLTVDDPVVDGERFLAEDVAALLLDVLSDPHARMPAFGRWGPLARPYPAAVKTGTSSGFRDNWTVGTTSEIAVGVWVGNFDGRQMGDVSGVTGAGPLWAAVMDRATGKSAAAFAPPPGAVRETVCALSGMAPGADCRRTHVAWRLDHQDAPAACTWHLPGCDLAWPPAYTDWAAGQGVAVWKEGCPTTGGVAIASPAPGAVLYLDPRVPAESQRVALRAMAPTGARRATWRVDGEVVAELGPPFVHLWSATPGPHRVTLAVDGVEAAPAEIHVGGDAR